MGKANGRPGDWRRGRVAWTPQHGALRHGSACSAVSTQSFCGVAAPKPHPSGWHVAFMPLVYKSRATPNETSGTHKPETGVRCWGRQQNVASACYMGRWGAGFGASGAGRFLEKLENHVRLTNLRLLQVGIRTGWGLSLYALLQGE